MEITDGQLADLLLLAQNLLMTFGLKVLGAIVVIIIGRMIAGFLRKSLVRFMTKTETDPTLAKFLSSLAYYVVLVVVAVAALSMVGIQMASVLTILATAGLAVGLALQGTLSNVAAGVMLLIFRPFKVGDLIEAGGGPTGKVESIGLFSTALNTPDNIMLESCIISEKSRPCESNDASPRPMAVPNTEPINPTIRDSLIRLL